MGLAFLLRSFSISKFSIFLQRLLLISSSSVFPPDLDIFFVSCKGSLRGAWTAFFTNFLKSLDLKSCATAYTTMFCMFWFPSCSGLDCEEKISWLLPDCIWDNGNWSWEPLFWDEYSCWLCWGNWFPCLPEVPLAEWGWLFWYSCLPEVVALAEWLD